MSSPYPAYGERQAASPYLYPPNGGGYDNLRSSSSIHLNANASKADPIARSISRTPSPTPSEAAELKREGALDWKRLGNWRFWIRKEWTWYYVGIILIGILTAVLTIYHQQIVDKLKPAATKIKGIPAGWVIPIAILFVLSFPPLFGHEIIAILCGVVWGLWIGFAIVAAGTFFGEVGNFYAFKWCCRARGEKLERTNFTYGILARVVREGGFKIALIARLSAIPGHFTTAVFSTCGMGIITFSIAAILSLPKQFVTVYLGVLIEGADTETTSQRIASYAVVAVSVVITVLAMWYIYRQMSKQKPAYIYERRKARQGKLTEAGMSVYGSQSASFNSSSTVTLGASPAPMDSTADVALHAYSPHDPTHQHQQWDASGRAVGYVPDPRLHAPTPRSAGSARVPTFRTEGGGGYDSTGRRYTEDGESGGVVYPASPREDGRLPVRQNSDDSWEARHGASTPRRARSPPTQERHPMGAPAYPRADDSAQSQPQSAPAPVSSFHPPPSSAHIPGSPVGMYSSPTQQPPSHPPPPASAPAGASWEPPPQQQQRAFSPPPPSYHSAAPR
ncbi:hypothetical protein OF83DRAFT_1135849 [Amylostereum chailletii]|nr:hypothetical protein OF83DRAFT_1135849 [Amylostereum chailletii]